MTIKNLTIAFLTAAILASCSGVKVITDYDRTVDFNQYKTLEYWGWAENSDQILNRFDKDRIESAFADEFKKRGINVVEKGQGDLIVSLFIVTEQKTQRSATTTHMGGGFGGFYDYYDYGPGFGWGGGHSTTTFHEYNYTVGTLAVSVFDAKKEVLIWEAVGEGTVDDNPETRDEDIPKAVAKIMQDYPVKPAGQ